MKDVVSEDDLIAQIGVAQAGPELVKLQVEIHHDVGVVSLLEPFLPLGEPLRQCKLPGRIVAEEDFRRFAGQKERLRISAVFLPLGG